MKDLIHLVKGSFSRVSGRWGGDGGGVGDNDDRSMESDVLLSDFNTQAEESRRLLKEAERKIEAVQEKYESAINAIGSKKLEEKRAEAQEGLDDIRKLMNRIKAQNAAVERISKNEKRKTSSVAEIHRTAIEDLGRRTQAVARKLLDMQTKWNQDYKKVIKVRAEAVSGQPVTEDQVDHLIATGTDDKLYRMALEQKGAQAVQMAIQEIEERNRAFKSLEQSLHEVVDMMYTMAVLVVEQGEKIDGIQETVVDARVDVEAGVKNLVVAQGHKNSLMRWQRMLCIFGLLAALIITVIVVLIVVR